MLKKNSINSTILKYFLLFSIVILILLWLFQSIFFNTFYRNQKINDVDIVVDKIKEKHNTKNFNDYINELAFEKSVCIEITSSNYDLLYSSAYFGKGCFSGLERTYNYKSDFINKNYLEKTYEVTNQTFDNTTIVKAIKLNNSLYAFVNTSLEPVDGIVNKIKKELIVISLLILLLSFILAYFISRHISHPIKEISRDAKRLAKGDFDINFLESNILEIDELASTLNYTKDELSKTDELRRDLMANVSHDLKTPLTMIKAYAEMIRDLTGNNKVKRENDLNIIIDEVDRLNLLVNDILSLSKLENNIEVTIKEEFDLVKMIETIINRFKIFSITQEYEFVFLSYILN